MPTIEELKKQIEKEKAIAKGSREFDSEAVQKGRLEKELKSLQFKRRNPTLVKLGQVLKKGASATGTKLGQFADNLGQIEMQERKKQKSLKQDVKKKIQKRKKSTIRRGSTDKEKLIKLLAEKIAKEDQQKKARKVKKIIRKPIAKQFVKDEEIERLMGM